jgi:hypothetical protein
LEFELDLQNKTRIDLNFGYNKSSSMIVQPAITRCPGVGLIGDG